MTQEQCERAVTALQKSGFSASHVQGAPDDHGVWLDGVWNDVRIDRVGDNDLQNATSFRIHDEEIEWWQTQDK